MKTRDRWKSDAFDQLPDAAMVLDMECVVRAINRKACELLEVKPEDVEGKPCTESCVCGRGEQHCFVRRILKEQDAIEEEDARIVGGCGKAARMVVTAAPVRDGEGKIIGGMEVLRDVSLLETANKDLKQLADNDELTGLSRRHVLFRALEKEAARNSRHGNPFSVLMIDIDDFKRYNDRFGHQAGDEVLRTVGRILREEARQEDTVARYGGEEFVSVLAESGPDRARAVAERMVERIRESTALEAPDGEPVTVSVGIAACDDDGSVCDAYSMIREADDVLYQAKRAGKNTVRFAKQKMLQVSNKEGNT